MGELAVTVTRVKDEALDIKSFELVGADASVLPRFTAGAHVDVHIAPGLVRQYSLCSDPERHDAYVIAVKKEAASRGGSLSMHGDVEEGDRLTIGQPRNNFPLDPAARQHVLLAGGIGITPLLSMALHLARRGAAFQLRYFARSERHAAFRELLSGPPFTGEVSFHYGLEPAPLAALLRDWLQRHPDGGHLYFCGPRPFMDLVRAAAQAAWPPENLHCEYFTADPAVLSGRQQSFKVRLARSGGEYVVAAGQSIVNALAAHGIAIKTQCEQGICGTCVTGVLEGMPEHRDVFLTDSEKLAGNEILPCVSRSCSEVLVLDL